MKFVAHIIKAALCSTLLMAGLTGCGGSDTTTPAATVVAGSSWANLSLAAGNQQVTISWDKPGTSASTTSTIYYSTDSTKANKKDGFKIANVSSPFVHTGLTNGATYFYVVTETTAAGEGPESHQAAATPQTQIPAAPSGLKITAKESEVVIGFDVTAPKPSAITLRYNIYWSTANTFTKNSATKIPNVSITPADTTKTYSHLSRANDTPYYYAVSVEVDGLESNLSNILSATPKKAVAPIEAVGATPGFFGSPTDLTVDVGNLQATVNWTSTESPTALGTGYSSTPVYTLYTATDSAFTLNLNKLSYVTPGYTMTGLANDAKYFFKVSAGVQKIADGTLSNEVFSTVISATPEAKKPAVPSGITTSRGDQQVSLSWAKDKSGIPSTIIGSVSYNIYYSTLAQTSAVQLRQFGTKISNIPTNSYVHSGLTPGKTYYYVITAVGEDESAPSDITVVAL